MANIWPEHLDQARFFEDSGWFELVDTTDIDAPVHLGVITPAFSSVEGIFPSSEPNRLYARGSQWSYTGKICEVPPGGAPVTGREDDQGRMDGQGDDGTRRSW